MSTSAATSSSRVILNINKAAAVATFLIVMFLFYIDEGYYDFRWMKDWGNWVVFCIYLMLVFPVMWLLAYVLTRRLAGWKQYLVLSVIGLLLAVAVSFLFFT
jgi:hypothetical protein